MVALIHGMAIFSGIQPAYADVTGTTTGTTGGEYTLLEPLPCISTRGCKVGNSVVPQGNLLTSLDFKGYVQYIFDLAIAIAAVAAVFMIVYGGFEYMTTDSFNGKSDGLKKLQNAIYGLLLILCSFLILRTINPQLVAIPDTLVTPLTLNSVSISDFLTILQKQAEGYRTNTTDSLKAIAAAQTQVDGIESNKKTLGNKILQALGYPTVDDPTAGAASICEDTSAADNPNVADMCAQLAKLNNDETGVNNTIALQTAKGLLTGGSLLEKCSPTGDPTLCDVDQVQTIYTKFSTLVSPDQLQYLQSAQSYAQTVLRINQKAAQLYAAGIEGIVAQFVDNSVKISNPNGIPAVYQQYQDTITFVNSLTDNYISKAINDPALIIQMQQQQKDLIAILNNITYHR